MEAKCQWIDCGIVEKYIEYAGKSLRVARIWWSVRWKQEKCRGITVKDGEIILKAGVFTENAVEITVKWRWNGVKS